MNDTDPDIAACEAAYYAAMTPLERMRIASSLYETARTTIASSLPQGLSREERRLAIATRMCGSELPEAALLAYARHPAGN